MLELHNSHDLPAITDTTLKATTGKWDNLSGVAWRNHVIIDGAYWIFVGIYQILDPRAGFPVRM